MVKTIVGTFDTAANAQKAATDLIRSGFLANDISVVASDAARVNGELVRALMEAGVSQEDAGNHMEAVRRGGALVTILTDPARTDEAAKIMSAHSAVDIEQRVLRWREEGWTGWDHAAPPFTTEEAERERRLYGAHADPVTGLPTSADIEGDNQRDSTIRH